MLKKTKLSACICIVICRRTDQREGGREREREGERASQLYVMTSFSLSCIRQHAVTTSVS